MADFVMTLDDFIAELEKIRGQLDGTVPVLNAEDDLPVRPCQTNSATDHYYRRLISWGCAAMPLGARSCGGSVRASAALVAVAC
jgi:hypothetical protein